MGTNGIYFGTNALLKFFGPWQWDARSRKLEFDFDEIAVLSLRIRLPKGGAARIGASTGLGSESNIKLESQGKLPFFNWIYADDDLAMARGGGGGVALWKRDTEMQELETQGLT